VLEDAQLAGERWRLPELCGMAARGIAAVQDEYLERPDEALKVLDATAARAGDSLMVRYQRGDISWDVLLKQWRAGASRMRSPPILTSAVETIERICKMTPMEIYRECAVSASPRFNQIVGGIRLVVHPDSKPALRYVGLCGLVIDVGFATNMMFSHDALAKLTRKTGLAILSAPFELSSPRITVPAIKAACESNKKGLALAASIVLAAGDAVTVSKMGNTMDQLQKLANG
jgi:hypothetical protein